MRAYKAQINGTFIAATVLLVAGCASDGADGMDGVPGTNGDSCTVTDNGDGTYDITCGESTVTVSDGTDGEGSGLSSLVVTTVEEAGENCAAGGHKIDVGLDDNADGVLDEDEIDQTTYVCNGGDAAPLDLAASVGPESCAVCHEGAGDEHQAIYDDYSDESDLVLTFDSVLSTGPAGGPYTTVLTFSITFEGRPFIDADGLPSMDQKRFYAVTYDAAARTFDDSKSFGDIRSLGDGTYTATATGITYRPERTNAHVYGYVAMGRLDTEGMALYDHVSNAALGFGTVTTEPYESLANVSACTRCHGTPYMKHGYRNPIVEGLGDFESCKSCHYDTRPGGHQDWQLLVDNPPRYAELAELAAEGAAAGDRTRDSIREVMTDEERARYAYTANLMNDVHMSHAMEFPFPQSIATCATCHEGHLSDAPGELFDMANFTKETCVSCHAWTGDPDYPVAATPLQTIWANAGLAPTHASAATTPCTSCHTGAAGTTTLASLHNGGYNPMIYSENGEHRYSDVFTGSIDRARYTASSQRLNIRFSTTEVGGAGTIADFDADDIVPTLLVGLYGYDSKDFIVAAHGRDEDRNRLLEFPIGTDNPRLEVVSATPPNWEVNVDLSMWEEMLTPAEEGVLPVIRRAEISFLPTLTRVVGVSDAGDGTACDPACGRGQHCEASACVPNDDVVLAVNAPSRTFNFVDNAFDDDFYPDIVDVENGCNSCHDALATTFHSANRGGNIRVCRTCHVTLSAGSHLELQSRSIDSYVHAVHSFQVFDPGDIDYSDPVEAIRAEHHMEHVFPNFTIKNCAACHVRGMNNVPDQSRSMPGVLSGSDTVDGREIGDIPSVVVGPAARACGGCHRAQRINEDDFAGLTAFNQHLAVNGYRIVNDDGVLETVIETIMSMFE